MATVALLLGQEHSADTGRAVLPLRVVGLPPFHSLDRVLPGGKPPLGVTLAGGECPFVARTPAFCETARTGSGGEFGLTVGA